MATLYQTIITSLIGIGLFKCVERFMADRYPDRWYGQFFVSPHLPLHPSPHPLPPSPNIPLHNSPSSPPPIPSRSPLRPSPPPTLPPFAPGSRELMLLEAMAAEMKLLRLSLENQDQD